MMNKYKKGGYMQPSKEIKFGGVKRRKAADGGSGSGDGTKDNPFGGNTIRNDLGHTIKNGAVYDIKGKYLGRVMKPHTNASRGIYSPGGTDPNIPKTAREAKQNTPQGTGGGRTGKSGSNAKSQGKTVTPAKKGSSYAEAKKKDPKLDSYIKIRNNSKKGSAAYNAAQNKINSAYGKGPQRKVDITPVKAKKAEPIERKSTSDRIITISSDKPIKTASKPTPKSGSASSNKNNTGGGSGMGGVQSEKNKLKNLGITTESDTKLPPSLSNQQKRQNKRAGKRAERDENKAERKDRRNKIREIKGKPAKASYGMSKEYKKGGRKRAFVGAATGAITGALGSIGSGEGVKGMLKGAATGAVNSVVPGLGTAVGAGIGGKTPAVPAAPPAAGAGANAPVDPAVPAPVTPPVDPNATVTARKGKMKDRRKQAKKGARRKYV